MRLYYGSGSCALATHIVLEELGLPYEAVKLDLAAGDQTKPDYLAVNPKGRVPALVTPDGVLTETPALLAYLVQLHPDAGLAPADAFGFARMQEVISYLASTVHVAHAHKFRGSRWADDPAAWESMKKKVPESMLAVFRVIEDRLEGPWVLGEHYSAADAHLFTIARWLPGDGVDPARQLPRVAAHMARMLERPAVKRALAAEGLSA
jgi:glutathione S-transferase